MEFTITKRDKTTIVVSVSDEDADLTENRWYMAGSRGKVGKYVARPVNGKTTYLHRVVAARMGLDLGPSDGRGRSRASVDHIDGDKLNNRRENLRLASRPEQMTNPADGLRSSNTSGHRGVSFIKATGKWMAHAMTDGRSISLGVFDTKDEAVARRAEWDRAPWAPPPRRRLAPCGTSAGYQRCKKNDGRACAACLAARAEYERDRKQRAPIKE